jgi:acyl carrier protein
MDTRAEVKRIIIEQLGVEASQIVDAASFIDDLGADSLAIVELVLAFEEHFGITIPEDAAQAIATVGDAVSYIEEHVPTAKGDARPEGELRP